MKIHEYQAKALLRKAGVPVPRGTAAFSVDEAVAAAKALPGPVYVVKAQIHAGGRGKGGGVKLARSIDEVKTLSEEILGMQLVTIQTGPDGQKVGRLLVEEGMDIKSELYLAVIVDRASGRPVIMASTEGGMDIEEVAANTPEKIVKEIIDPTVGLTGFQARRLAYGLGMEGKTARKGAYVIAKLFALFEDTDCSIAEINPLIITGGGDVVALDAKLSFDENALGRLIKKYPEVEGYADPAESDPMELEAAKHQLSYIKLDGKIGCMVNGAGLAMATMDIIKLYGSEPANFLDVGGGATKERVTAAFKIITADPSVEGILVNIFGGIMQCDVIAAGVVAAVKDVGLKVPLVVRLEGTNVNEGKAIIENSGLAVISADGMEDAAKKIVAAVNGGAQ